MIYLIAANQNETLIDLLYFQFIEIGQLYDKPFIGTNKV